MQPSPPKGEKKALPDSHKSGLDKEANSNDVKQDKEKTENDKKKEKDKERDGKSPSEGKKQKGGFGALKAKLNDAKDAVKDNATNLANKVKDGLEDSDDSEDSSADDDDDDWLMDDASEGATTTASTKIAPSATAITFRNKPAPEFLNLEEEKQIRAQVKSAKQVRKKTKKLRKRTLKTVKYCQQSALFYERFIAFANEVAQDNLCTDPAIAKSLREAVSNFQNFRESRTFATLNESITSIGEQLDAVRDHSKLLATTEKERREARDKRIKMDQSEIDVTDEAEYRKAIDTKTDYKEKDARYKEEFKSFFEHNSSQLGQTLRNTLLSNAKFLEDLAGALRQAANVEGNNCWFFSDEAVNKYADFKVDPELIKPSVQLFGDGNAKDRATEDAYDRLTVKPPSQQPNGEAVQGIPVTESGQNGAAGYNNAGRLPAIHTNGSKESSSPKNKKAEQNEKMKKEYFGCYLPS